MFLSSFRSVGLWGEHCDLLIEFMKANERSLKISFESRVRYFCNLLFMMYKEKVFRLFRGMLIDIRCKRCFWILLSSSSGNGGGRYKELSGFFNDSLRMALSLAFGALSMLLYFRHTKCSSMLNYQELFLLIHSPNANCNTGKSTFLHHTTSQWYKTHIQ